MPGQSSYAAWTTPGSGMAATSRPHGLWAPHRSTTLTLTPMLILSPILDSNPAHRSTTAANRPTLGVPASRWRPSLGNPAKISDHVRLPMNTSRPHTTREMSCRNQPTRHPAPPPHSRNSAMRRSLNETMFKKSDREYALSHGKPTSNDYGAFHHLSANINIKQDHFG